MKRLLLVLAVLFMAAPEAHASSLLDFQGTGYGETVTLGGTVKTGQVFAGEIKWAWLNPVPSGWSSASFYTYCIELVTYLTDPQAVDIKSTNDFQTNSTPATTVVDGAKKAAWLLNNYQTDIRAGVGTGNLNDRAAGLQVAMWEALYDSTLDITGGRFYVTAPTAVISWATTYLTQLGQSDYSQSSAAWLAASTGQDQIATSPVPEPTSLLLLGSGLAGLIAKRRRGRA